MEWTIGIAAFWIYWSALGYWIALQKRREPFEGLVLGLLFGPLGAIIEALLPNGERGGKTRVNSREFNPVEPDLSALGIAKDATGNDVLDSIRRGSQESDFNPFEAPKQPPRIR